MKDKKLRAYHGTSAKEFDIPNGPFWLTKSYEKAERFSLRGNGEGPRRIIEYEYSDLRLFVYNNETVLEEECGRRFDGEDGVRYRAIAERLQELDWDGYVEGQTICVFNPKDLKKINVVYLDEIDESRS